jgi:hypothetical protein
MEDQSVTIRPIPIALFAATVFGVLVVIVLTTGGTLQNVLIVVALLVMVALGTPLALGKLKKKERQRAIPGVVAR